MKARKWLPWRWEKGNTYIDNGIGLSFLNIPKAIFLPYKEDMACEGKLKSWRTKVRYVRINLPSIYHLHLSWNYYKLFPNFKC